MNTPRVVISPNIKKVSERIDMNGNVIDPRTKRIINPVEPVTEEEPKQE